VLDFSRLSLAALACLDVDAMRLIHTTTLEITLFLQRELPEYVILSHTWGEEEVTLQDMQSGTASEKKGYAKIVGCCKKAAEDGYLFCWIDTCCIDKTSSAELSEAINSMYRWYEDSNVCYAYIADVPSRNNLSSFLASKWFKRGWTLQELIAPPIVEFYAADWSEIGTRLSRQKQIANITGISLRVLQGEDLASCNVAERMSWAAHRITTRLEDEAYCLMGIFRINMPLLYGEGSRAFQRLQEAIMREEEDYTLFVWSNSVSNMGSSCSGGLLAQSPGQFENMLAKVPSFGSLENLWYGPVETLERQYNPANMLVAYERLSKSPSSLFTSHQKEGVPLVLTNRGIQISLPIMKNFKNSTIVACLSILTIPRSNATTRVILLCIPLYAEGSRGQYVRRVESKIWALPQDKASSFSSRTIYVEQTYCNMVPRTIAGANGSQTLMLTMLTPPLELAHKLFLSADIATIEQLIQSNSRSPDARHEVLASETSQSTDLPRSLLGLLRDSTLREIANGRPSSCYLFGHSSDPDRLDLAIRGKPMTKMTLTFNLQGRMPSFNIKFYGWNLWDGIDEDCGRTRKQFTEDRIPTSNYLMERDRAEFCITLDVDATWEHLRETHTVTISLRRIGSAPGAPYHERFLLTIRQQLLATGGQRTRIAN